MGVLHVTALVCPRCDVVVVDEPTVWEVALILADAHLALRPRCRDAMEMLVDRTWVDLERIGWLP